jgi:anti-anti-sigma factor
MMRSNEILDGHAMQIFKREIIRQSTVLTLEIQSLDASNAQRVSRSLAEAMRGIEQVVVDLGALRYFDVNGFAAILKWAADREGPDIRFCSQSGTVQALFELLDANSVVPLFQNREEAMASFRRSVLPAGRDYAATLSTRGEDTPPGSPTLWEP